MRRICMSALYTNTYLNVDGVKHDGPAGVNISSAYTTTKWVFLISAHFMKTSALLREDVLTSGLTSTVRVVPINVSN